MLLMAQHQRDESENNKLSWHINMNSILTHRSNKQFSSYIPSITTPDFQNSPDILWRLFIFIRTVRANTKESLHLQRRNIKKKLGWKEFLRNLKWEKGFWLSLIKLIRAAVIHSDKKKNPWRGEREIAASVPFVLCPRDEKETNSRFKREKGGKHTRTHIEKKEGRIISDEESRRP